MLVGPGENAGVVDVGDGIAAAFRIESHNHPSAIEPYQGAATGVGGILRDIFTMGARPIALMDPLRFGPLDDARSRWIAEGVVSGHLRLRQLRRRARPSAARSCSTRPTRTTRSSTCSASGCCRSERLVLGRASGAGNLAVLLGSSTGRDGIGGVSVLASAGFGEPRRTTPTSARACRWATRSRRSGSSRPASRCSTPGWSSASRTSAGAGLTCATSETASTGGVGMDVYVSEVPLREPGMEPFEVMTSESQERMLAIVAPERPRRGARHLRALGGAGRRWSARSPTGGRLRILDRLRRRGAGRRARRVAPRGRPALRPAPPAPGRPRRAPGRRPGACVPAPDDCGADLLGAARRHRRGSVASTTTSCSSTPSRARAATPPCCASSTRPAGATPAGRWRSPPTATTAGARSTRAQGTALVVAEAASEPGLRRRPPARPRQLPQLRQPRAPRGDVAAVGGDRRHGRGLPGARPPGRRRQRQPLQREPGARHRPHAGGRRARPGRPARPAAARACGLVDGGASCCSAPRQPELGGSAWAWQLHGHRGGAPAGPRPRGAPSRWLDLVRELVADGSLAGVHDVADGGLGVALAEMAVRVGRRLRRSRGVAGHARAVRRVPVAGRAVRRPGATRRRRDRAAPRPPGVAGHRRSAAPAATAWSSRASSTSRWPTAAWRAPAAWPPSTS